MWVNKSIKVKLISACILLILVSNILLAVFVIENTQRKAFDPANKIINEQFQRPPLQADESFKIEMEQKRQEFIYYTIALIIIITFISALILYLIITKCLKPLLKFNDEIKNLDEKDLTKQIKIEDADLEVETIVKSFNNLLNKLSEAFTKQKRFSANIAHELKTPLATLQSNLEVFAMDQKHSNKDYNELIGLVEDNTTRLIDIVNTLLRINENSNLEYSDFSLKELINEIIYEFDKHIKYKKISINVSDDLIITTDRLLFKRVLSNIIDNAIKYNYDEGTIDININDNQLIIKDSGQGIPDDALASIFDPFYCVEYSRSRAFNGSGLGLCLSKEIATRLNYTIDVSSVLEQGSTFTINLNNK